MTKADLVELIYQRVGSSKKEACEVVEVVFTIIRESLRRGEKVKVSGFGSFVVNRKRARRGRNPQTGEPDHDRFPRGAVIQAESGAQGIGSQRR